MGALMLGGCAGAVGGRQIGGIEWAAVNINGVPVEAGAPVTLRLEGGDRIAGNAGCNTYSGSYRTTSKERIRVSALIITTVACAPARMDQERRYLSIIESAEGYSFYGDGSFSLIAGDGRAVRFRRR